MPKLSKAAIAAIESPAAGAATVWDTVTRGLGVRASSGGSKSFVLKYRTHAGRQRLMTIARVGALTLDEARGEAEKIRGAVARGEDPAGEKLENRRAMLVRELVELYGREGLVVQRGLRQGQPMKPLTASYTLARLRHHVVPLLGARQAKDIGPADIERMVREISAGRTAKVEKPDGRPRAKIIVRGGEGAARKVARDLSAVMSFAKRRGIVTANPCETAAIRKTDGQRTRFLSESEMQRLGEALSSLALEGMNPHAANIIRLWALTGARRNEIAGLKWDEVDLAGKKLRLADSKSGRSVRPLGSGALKLLIQLHDVRRDGGKYVFPAKRGEGFYQGVKGHWPKIMSKAKLNDVSPHTLRHSLGSSAASLGESLLLVGAILGHANPRSTSIYAHIEHGSAQLAADRATGNAATAMTDRPRRSDL